jgi:hypothetical protein
MPQVHGYEFENMYWGDTLSDLYRHSLLGFYTTAEGLFAGLEFYDHDTDTYVAQTPFDPERLEEEEIEFARTDAAKFREHTTLIGFRTSRPCK